MRTLLVDDSAVSRQLLQHHLRNYSECDSAKNGREGFEVFTRNLEAQRPYDFVCLDLQMPGIDGLQLLKLIRAREAQARIASRANILVVTATADAEMVTKVMAEGADGYMLKPMSPKKLRDYMINVGLMSISSSVKIEQLIHELGELCDSDQVPSPVLTSFLRRITASVERQALRNQAVTSAEE